MKVVKRSERGQPLTKMEAFKRAQRTERERVQRFELNHMKLLDNLAQYYLTLKRDNVPWEMLHEVTQIVRTNTACGLVSMAEWNRAMKRVQLAHPQLSSGGGSVLAVQIEEQSEKHTIYASYNFRSARGPYHCHIDDYFVLLLLLLLLSGIRGEDAKLGGG